MKIRFALFDFDGVIADTEQSNARYLAKALAHYGITLSEEERRSLLGVNEPSRLEAILKRSCRPVTLEEFRALRASLGNTYENGSLSPMPHLLPVLTELRRRGVALALVTSTSSHLIAAGLRRLRLEDLFDVVICGDMVSKRKPDPEPYRKAMDRLGAAPEECVVIEDSPVGIQAGKAAGAAVIGFRGSGIRQDTSQADYQLDTFSDFFSLPLTI